MDSFAEMSFNDIAAYVHENVTPNVLNTIKGEELVKLVDKLQSAGQVLDDYFWFLVHEAVMNSN